MNERLTGQLPHPVRLLHSISSRRAAALLAIALCLHCFPASQAAEPNAPRPPTAATVPPGSKPGAEAGGAEIQAGIRKTADVATKLFAATEDLKSRTANLRILPGGSATKKTPYLLSQVDDLDKQRAKLRAEIAGIEDYKVRNPRAWGDDLENKLLELQISERTIAQSLDGMRQYLEAKHRWYLLGL